MKSDFETFAEELKSTASIVWSVAAGSFVFPLIPLVLGQHDPVFVAVAEVIAGLCGVAAVLSAYASVQPHPKDMADMILAMDEGPSASLSGKLLAFFVITVIGVFIFNRFSADMPVISVAALGIANFFLCLALAQFVLFLRFKRKQKTIWEAMPPQLKIEWILRQNELNAILEDLEEALQLSKGRIKDINAMVRDMQREALRSIRKERLSAFWSGFRKLAGFGTNLFLTNFEVAEEELAQKRFEEWWEEGQGVIQKQAWVEISAGRIDRQALEGASEVALYKWQDRWFAVIDRDIDNAYALDLVKKLKALSGRVAVLVAPEASATIEAKATLKAARFDVTKVRNPPQSEVASQ